MNSAKEILKRVGARTTVCAISAIFLTGCQPARGELKCLPHSDICTGDRMPDPIVLKNKTRMNYKYTGCWIRTHELSSSLLYMSTNPTITCKDTKRIHLYESSKFHYWVYEQNGLATMIDEQEKSTLDF